MFVTALCFRPTNATFHPFLVDCFFDCALYCVATTNFKTTSIIMAERREEMEGEKKEMKEMGTDAFGEEEKLLMGDGDEEVMMEEELLLA